MWLYLYSRFLRMENWTQCKKREGKKMGGEKVMVETDRGQNETKGMERQRGVQKERLDAEGACSLTSYCWAEIQCH